MTVIINAGNALYQDGRKVNASQLNGKHVYVRGKTLPDPYAGEKASIGQCSKLLDACQAFSWKDPVSANYLAGWFIVANIAGTLPIRPHIWVTGPKGTGKSTIFRKLAPVLMPAYYPYVGSTTEAAIRQSHQHSCFPITFDEFEPTDHDQDNSRDKVLELFRQAWSDTDGTISRGGPGGHASHYRLITCAMLASINVHLKNEADRSRFTILELEPHDPKGSERFEKITSQVDAELGLAIWRRTVGMIKMIKANFALIRAILIQRGETSRWADQHAMLAAGFQSLVSDGILTDSDGRDILANGLFSREEPDTEEWEEILTMLSTTQIRPMGGSHTTLGHMISTGENDELLKKSGIKLIRVDEVLTSVLISNTHRAIAEIMRRSKWRNGWSSALSRIPGALKSKDSVWFGDHKTKYVSVPMKYFMGS